jgi:uncharacterized protein (TIGR02118 family)
MESSSSTDRDTPYHRAMIDGEMPEITVHQGQIEWQNLSYFIKSRKMPKPSTGTLLRPTSAREENSRSEESLKKYDINTGAVAAPAGASGIHLVTTLYFDSLDSIKAGLASPQRQAAAGDLANFADGGAELYFFDTKDV